MRPPTPPTLFYIWFSLSDTVHAGAADITYQSLAAAFEQPLEHHTETLRRMSEMIRHRADLGNQTDEQRVARERMALFPARAEVLYIASDIWVVSLFTIRYNNNVYWRCADGEIWLYAHSNSRSCD